MDLREFISQGLQDVVGGILDAQKAVEAMSSDAVVSPTTVTNAKDILVAAGRYQAVTMVQFDIAVSASTSGSVEGGASGKIKIWPLGGADGNAKANASHERGHESRIAFEVPIALPRQYAKNKAE
ncbi:MAG: hypothetical protein ACK5N1_03895 [Gemmatimonas sp.]|jgi:predicted RNA-binding Zn ribbon-like protein|uniref:hypothetical protein n=1 Tax=Gemmatimonas sp. TaxID=1962908 RepID=UPI00391FB381